MRRLYPFLSLLLCTLLLNACGNSTGKVSIHQSPLSDASSTCSRNATAAGVPIVESGPCQYTFTPHQRMTTTQSTTVQGAPIDITIIFDVETSKVYLQDGSQWDPIAVDAGSLSEVSPYWVWEYTQLKGATTIGIEAINGVQAQHIHGTLSVDASATVDVWIAVENGFPLKWIATLKQSDAVSTETILFDKWNTGADIPLPA